MLTSTLRERPVVIQGTKEKVGHVVELLFDATCREVLGFRVQRGRRTDGKHAEAFLWSALHSMDTDGMSIHSFSDLHSEDRFVPLAHAIGFAQLLTTRVASQDGTSVGKISDIELDEQAHLVQALFIGALTKEQPAHQPIRITVDHLLQMNSNGTMILDLESTAQVLLMRRPHP
jgi:uncharacterized protein YrrD